MIKKILLAPLNLLKKIFSMIKDHKTIKRNKKELKPLELEEIARSWFIVFKEDIQFKLVIGDNGNELSIYSKNFKTTLEKAKKRDKKENDNENTSINEPN